MASLRLALPEEFASYAVQRGNPAKRKDRLASGLQMVAAQRRLAPDLW